MKITIKCKFTDAIKFEGEYESLKHAVIVAVKQGADLQGANLRGADLWGANLWGANLRGAYLQGAYLRGADLQGANLWGANLRGAYLRGADLQGANLRGADLWGADLRGADLQGADLQGADLWGADLWGANLWGANLWNKKQKIAPLQIIGLYWFVMTDGNTVKIGCQEHLWSDWLSFNDDEIANMHENALTWWREHKDLIAALVATHNKMEANHAN